MPKDKLIVISLAYGDNKHEVIIHLECDEVINSGDVYNALSQYLSEYELEVLTEIPEGETIH